MSESTPKAAKPAAKTPKVKAPKTPKEKTGNPVGYLAKTKSDCKWNKTRVEFYKALRKIGSGTAAEISKASGGKVSVGNCLNYGYYGVTPGLNKIEKKEDVVGFTFSITAKGKTVDLEKVLVTKAK